MLKKTMVSFIVPVFNAENDIGRCLASIQSVECLSYAYEIIVVDNGSTDRSREIVEAFGLRPHVFPGLRVGALRNRGVERAKGEYIAFVDSDVELGPQWLTAALEVFDDEDVVATGCFPKSPTPGSWVQQTWDIHQRLKAEASRKDSVSWLPSMNLVLRRDVFIAVGGFNETLVTAEDVDLCYRLVEKGVIRRNANMKAVHWGEAKSLARFWSKELWRGRGNIRGVFLHRFRWEELPSVCYPFYLMVSLGILVASLAFDVHNGVVRWSFIVACLWIAPACLLAADTVRITSQVKAFPKLALLYFVYGLARACSIISLPFAR